MDPDRFTVFIIVCSSFFYPPCSRSTLLVEAYKGHCPALLGAGPRFGRRVPVRIQQRSAPSDLLGRRQEVVVPNVVIVDLFGWGKKVAIKDHLLGIKIDQPIRIGPYVAINSNPCSPAALSLVIAKSAEPSRTLRAATLVELTNSTLTS